MRFPSLLWVLACAWMCAGVGEQSATAATPQQEAYQLFQESEGRYRAGDFAGAAAKLKRAHSLYPEPTLLYNLGRALEGADDLSGAIAAYSEYLAVEKKLIDRGAIQQQIATLRRHLAEREHLNTAQLEAEHAREDAERARLEAERQIGQRRVVSPPTRARIAAPWIVAGVGGLGLITGGVLSGVALDKHHDANSEPKQQTAVDLQNTARHLAIGANVSYGVGGVLAVVGVVWGIVEARQRHITHVLERGAPLPAQR